MMRHAAFAADLSLTGLAHLVRFDELLYDPLAPLRLARRDSCSPVRGTVGPLLPRREVAAPAEQHRRDMRRVRFAIAWQVSGFGKLAESAEGCLVATRDEGTVAIAGGNGQISDSRKR